MTDHVISMTDHVISVTGHISHTNAPLFRAIRVALAHQANL